MPVADELRRPPAATLKALLSVRRAAARRLFVVIAVIAVLAAFASAMLPAPLAAERRALLVALLLGAAGLALLADRFTARHFDLVVTAVCALSIGTTAAAVHLLGWGADGAAVGLIALLVLAAVALVPRAGALTVLWLALVATALPAALQWRAQVGGAGALPPVGMLGVLLMQWLSIAGGVGIGWLLARLVSGHVIAAEEREQRFRRLLAIAADIYWELDDQYRLKALVRQADDGGGSAPVDDDGAIGHVPWALPQFMADADTLDRIQADLDARATFRDVVVQWVTVEGDMMHFAVSGEPRSDQRGLFLGYWGVARDVTAEVEARAALAETEGRYQDLFEHIPTPLLLHRIDRVIDANPAAQSIFGHDDGMVGMEVLALFEAGDSRERARRQIEQVEQLPIGRALPVWDFRLRGRGGRRIAARGTSVRVATEHGPATLTIIVDDTDRRAAEDAVRRSETMLSHLVATSPDVITLTELVSGRYAMVNRTFERLMGYSAAEVVGRTSTELGVWQRPEQRAEFVALIQRDGQVQDLPVDFGAKDGRVVPMLVSGARFLMDRREYLVINARDVTDSERERLERKAVLDSASVGIAFSRERIFVMANPCFERMIGWPEGTLRGQSGRVVWTSDEEYASVWAIVGPALERGESVVFEQDLQRRDGSRFLARVTASPIDPRRPAEGGTVWIVEDVTEARRSAAALARARDEAEAANRAKSTFLANTSHELRTPLNAMIGLARLARDPGLDPSRRAHYLDQIGDSAESLAAIISDILDLSKIESGRLQVEAVPFDLAELLRKLHQGYTLLADARGLRITLEVDEGVAGMVRGDALRVRQILSNYLGNALKFTESGVVRLVARPLAGDLLRFEVHDSGPGIDAATQVRLFRPFTQADESTTRRYGGTGLGLSICRELAQLMGGQVGVDSRIGQGSCFWAELPLPALGERAPVQPVSPGPDLAGMKVMLVEDNPVNMLIAVAMLEQWGVQVTQATDGRQALAAVAAAGDSPDALHAILMDVQMPQMSGYEATRELRRTHGPRLPVIALTAAALVSEREQALAAGMNDFLTKPIDAERLRATLARWGRRA